MQIPFDGTERIERTELARLIENDRLLAYVLANVNYLEDRLLNRNDSERYWDEKDDSRTDQGESMPLREYLQARVDGRPIWTAPPKDEAAEYHDDDERSNREPVEPMHYAGLMAETGRTS